MNKFFKWCLGILLIPIIIIYGVVAYPFAILPIELAESLLSHIEKVKK